MKTCSRCLEELPVTSFHMKGKGYRRPECKGCFKASRPRLSASEREAGAVVGRSKADYQRFYKYGITAAAYRSMLAGQSGRCAICQVDDPAAADWQVDHDHATGAIRGLLCRPCNIALGLMRDDVTRLERAIAYLIDESG